MNRLAIPIIFNDMDIFCLAFRAFLALAYPIMNAPPLGVGPLRNSHVIDSNFFFNSSSLIASIFITAKVMGISK